MGNCTSANTANDWPAMPVSQQAEKITYSTKEQFDSEFNFEQGELLGTGKNSEVRKCISKFDNAVYAVKLIVEVGYDGLDHHLATVLKTKNSEYFVKVYDAYAWESRFEGVIPFQVRAIKMDAQETSLEHFIQQQIKNSMQWDEQDVFQIMQRLTRGLILLKQKNGHHGTINPNNILFSGIINENVTEQERQQISEIARDPQKWEQYQTTDDYEKQFKLGAFLSDPQGSHQQFFRKEEAIYMSPEMCEAYLTNVNKVKDIEKSDVFSLGLVILQIQLAVGPQLIAGVNQSQQALNKLLNLVTNEKMKTILTHCLEFDVNRRANLDMLTQYLFQ